MTVRWAPIAQCIPDRRDGPGSSEPTGAGRSGSPAPVSTVQHRSWGFDAHGPRKNVEGSPQASFGIAHTAVCEALHRVRLKSVAHLKNAMEQGFRPLKAGKMHPNALKTLPSGAARQGGLRILIHKLF